MKSSSKRFTINMSRVNIKIKMCEAISAKLCANGDVM